MMACISIKGLLLTHLRRWLPYGNAKVPFLNEHKIQTEYHVHLNFFLNMFPEKIEFLTLPTAYNKETHLCLPQLGESLTSAPSSLVVFFYYSS